jgi:peptidoglycan/xylan/chitin deacetylase (PgdA/CDA1 family)
VKPWNGYKGALSITFDDGLECQAEYAIPLLEKRGLRGTFFICAKNLGRCTAAWVRAAEMGHEIGSHSFGHFKPTALVTESDRDMEHAGSRNAIEATLNTRVVSYAYPYALVTPAIEDSVRRYYKQARGGHASPGDMLVSNSANLYNTRSFNTCAGNIREIPAMAAQAAESGTWLTLMLHGVGPDETQFDNILAADFDWLLSAIQDCKENNGLWVAPFGMVAQNLRDTGR